MSKLQRLTKFIPAIIGMSILWPVLSFGGQFKVVRVYDGDTIKVLANGKENIVRLVGIDAPEISNK